MVIVYIVIVIFVLYAGLLLSLWRYWVMKAPQSPASMASADPFFSIIVPARNEALRIEALLRALQQQRYRQDHFEVIVVDDESEDNTADVVATFPFVKLLSTDAENGVAHKKRALETGIRAAKFLNIITTDADCEPGAGWLEAIATLMRNQNIIVVAGPVLMKHNGSFLQLFQSLDFMMLQGVTGAALQSGNFAMANGANLAYRADAFRQVKGFENIDQVASGDDLLLMEKFQQQFPQGIRYLKSREAIVATHAEPTWRRFFRQRIRWASKARHYHNKQIVPVMLLVYLLNLSFFVLLTAGFIFPVCWRYLSVLLIAKTLVELPLFASVCSFFKTKNRILLFILFQPFHIIYTIVAGFFSQIGTYQWKGRRVR